MDYLGNTIFLFTGDLDIFSHEIKSNFWIKIPKEHSEKIRIYEKQTKNQIISVFNYIFCSFWLQKHKYHNNLHHSNFSYIFQYVIKVILKFQNTSWKKSKNFVDFFPIRKL